MSITRHGSGGNPDNQSDGNPGNQSDGNPDINSDRNFNIHVDSGHHADIVTITDPDSLVHAGSDPMTL